MSSAITDAKVVVLGLFSSYWTETSIPNLPVTVKITTSSYDQTIQNPQVVVGDQIADPGTWESSHLYMQKPKVEVHTYIRRDLSATKGDISNQDFGTLKKQEYAIIENIRVILTKHSDRPTTDCMFVFYDPQTIDRDVRDTREIMLHKIIRCTCWFDTMYS